MNIEDFFKFKPGERFMAQGSQDVHYGVVDKVEIRHGSKPSEDRFYYHARWDHIPNGIAHEYERDAVEKVWRPTSTSTMHIQSHIDQDSIDALNYAVKAQLESAKESFRTPIVGMDHAGCNHKWQHYVGAVEEYDFCIHCDEKRFKN